ncbi:MAG: FtsW/RodA/SpoVE family cell cycle protein, partial [Burkholderiales bacterium]
MIKRLWHYLTAHLDGFLLGTVFMLMLLGLFVLYSATGPNLTKTYNQFASILIALAVMWAVSNIPPQHLMRLSLPMYALGMVLLIAVALFGDVVNGARR